MTGTITLGRRTLGLLVLAAFLVGGLFASLALGIGQAQDDGSGGRGGSSQIRVLTERLDDGRIEVGVQQRELDGSWGRTYEPTRRFVPADAEPGKRLHSSPIALAIDNGQEAARAAVQQYLYREGETAGGIIWLAEGARGAPRACINYDPRNEGRSRYCDGVEAAFSETVGGTVVRIESSNPAEITAKLRAALDPQTAGGQAVGSVNISSYPGVLLAWPVLQERLALTGRRVPTDYIGELSAAIPPDPDALFCVIHHGSDVFWEIATEAMQRAALHYGLNNLRIINPHPYTAEAHVAAIRQCAADGAAGISTTLGSAALQEALGEAREAGVSVVSFNAGAEVAPDAGAAVHISVDEQGIGRKAGEAFNRRSAEGSALCVIHEAENNSLEERCQGLEQSYEGGEVEVIRLYEAADLRAGFGMIAARLAQGDVGAVLTLNSASAQPALQTIQAVGSQALVGTVGVDLNISALVASGQMLFAIWDQPLLQTYLSLASLMLADRLHLDPQSWFGSVRLSIEPRLLEGADMIALSNQLLRPGG